MWGVKEGMLGIVLVLILMLLPKTMQLTMDHPYYRVVNKINSKGPYLGLVLSSTSDEERLLDSEFYIPDTSIPPITIAGRQFNFGHFNRAPVVYVIAYSPLAYVSATAQIMLNTFSISGIIDYGSAATVSDSLAVADVAVLASAGFTGVWEWEEWKSSVQGKHILPTLSFGDFNHPSPGENELASIKYQNVKQYLPDGLGKPRLWHHADEQWFDLASKLKGLELDGCVKSYCAVDKPKVVYGVKGSSADIYLLNKAYGEFLNEKLGVSTVDTKSAATASTAIANGVPHIVFRAATNKPGAEVNSDLSALGGKNSLKVAAAFVAKLLERSSISSF